MKHSIVTLALLLFVAQAWGETLKFDFSGGKRGDKDFIKIDSKDLYNDERGYGYDFLSAPEGDDSPFFFSVKLPDGNYKVTVTLGSKGSAGETTLRCESRRLYAENVKTKKGEFVKKKFIVNKRDSIIGGERKVAIKADERQKLNWDNRLTIEVNGERPRVRDITIERDIVSPTVFLCGNSTVVDNDCEPYTGWGQTITCFFDDNVAIAYYAESGMAADTFIGQGRLDKALSQMKPGDYVLVEFAHNDQKQKGPGRGADYSFAFFVKQFIDEARAKGATPVLLTPTRRRFFDEDGRIANTHLDYPEVIRKIAAREGVPLIDLQEMTKVLCETMGEENSKKLFVYYPANTFKNQDKELKDNTHFSVYGAYEIARCVVEGMRYVGLPIVKHIRQEYDKGFSPAVPDKTADFKWVLSPFEFPEKDDNGVVDNTPDSINKALTARPVPGSTRKGANPVLFLVGNSTMRTGTLGNGDNGQWGWGYFMHEYFDPEKITVENHALGGMSSRTFYKRLWADVLKGIKKGDWVIIELGHNDNGPYDEGRARASIPGVGKETIDVTIKETGEKETVYTYGEYLRKFVRDVKAKGGYPILMSLTPKNLWVDADSTVLKRCKDSFGGWARQVAEQMKVPFVDLNEITASKYEKFGKDKVKTMFYLDRIHTSEFGARVNAESAVEGIRSNNRLPLAKMLLPEVMDTVTGKTRKEGVPMLFTIGDSTVKNEDKGEDGMWGWGSVIGDLFDSSQLTVENHAMPGRSARTFLDEGRWEKVYDALQPGDFVLMQFGHNDAGDINTGKARAELPGTGSESKVFKMEKTGRNQVVYTYGWYLRKFIMDAKEKGATPIVVSHTPRNKFDNGVIESNKDTFGKWAGEVAEMMGVPYIDLNAISGAKLQKTADEEGLKAVSSYYCNDHTHFSKKGARMNADSVAEGLKTACPELASKLKDVSNK